MNQFFQFLLNNATIIAFVLIGGLGALGRLAAWIKEQRAKRHALQARQRMELEAMRTGRPVESDQPVDAEEERRRALAAMQAQRAQQLRELQQRRLAELRAKRAAQQGQPAPAPVPSRQQPTPKPRATPRPQPQARPQPARPDPRRQAPPVASPRGRPMERAAAIEPMRGPTAMAEAIRPIAQVPTVARGPAPAPALLSGRDDLRRAILAAEILGPPLALRDDDAF